MNVFILLSGLLLMAVLLSDSLSGEWDLSNIVFTFFMIQSAPMILMEVWSFKHYKLMRRVDSRTTRKAELHSRRLFEFISPTIIGIAVFVYFAFIALILYIRQFEFPWFGGYWNIVGVTASNLIFAGIIFWNLYGKKIDPYQAYEDRKKQIELIVNQMVFMSIATTTFIAIEVVLASLDLRTLQPTVKSLYFQLLAVIGSRTLRIDNLNFDVYKEDPNEKKNTMMSEKKTVHEKSAYRYTAIYVSIGLSFGVALGLKEGATFAGLALIGGIGAGIGMILGLVIGSLLERHQNVIDS